MPIKHKFVSPIADDEDPDVVGPDAWNDDHEGSEAVGYLPFVYTNGLHAGHAIASNALNIAGNGGTVASHVVLSASLILDRLVFFNRATTGTHTFEWRLYHSAQSATVNEVPGANGSLTYSPTALSYEIMPAVGAPVLLLPGAYWLAFRLTSATAVNIGAIPPSWGNTPTGTNSVHLVQTLSSALGSTLDLVTGWTKPTSNMPMMRLDGRMFGEGSAF